jgi:hypothetical protein
MCAASLLASPAEPEGRKDGQDLVYNNTTLPRPSLYRQGMNSAPTKRTQGSSTW